MTPSQRVRRVDLLGDDRGLLLERLRAGAVITLAALVAFGVADVCRQPPFLGVLLTLKVALGVVLVVGLTATRRTASRRTVVGAAVAVVALTATTSAVSGVLTADPVSTPLLLVSFAITAATALPWGVAPQLATACIAAVGSAVTAGAIGGAGLVGSYPAIAVLIALVGSVCVAYEQGRRRRDAARLAELLDGQTDVLEMVAGGQALHEVLAALCRVVEQHGGGLLCSVLLVDGEVLRHAAAPSLPAEYVAAMTDGVPIGPQAGSCGTAAFRRAPVVVRDIATDPLWDGPRALALPHGLRACWSAPIIATDGRCLGTFAMYYREPREPDDGAWSVLQLATHLAGIAIERRRTEDALLASRRHAEEESQVSGALVRVGHVLNATLDTPEILSRLCELATQLVGCDCSDTVLPAADGETWAPISGSGYSDEEWESLRVLAIPGSVMAPLVMLLQQRGSIQFRTDDVADPATLAMLRRYGITASLYVALRRGDAVIGILSCATRSAATRFTDVQERVARGVAQLASLALENARLVEELRAADRLKSEFVSTMSHELRTPLSVILGYTDMLGDELPRREQERTLARIRRSGVELLEMIEATLNLSRLEAGKDPAQLEPFDVADLFEELAGEFGALDRPAATALRWDIPADLAVVTDRRKLKIVVKNLVGNALKFTPAGEVVVGCGAARDGCVVTVRDTGIGIAPEHLPMIFDMFRQVDSSDSRSYSGVGLGLYIVKRLVDQLGGHVLVESEVGRGTCFTVHLPAREPATIAAAS